MKKTNTLVTEDLFYVAVKVRRFFDKEYGHTPLSTLESKDILTVVDVFNKVLKETCDGKDEGQGKREFTEAEKEAIERCPLGNCD